MGRGARRFKMSWPRWRQDGPGRQQAAFLRAWRPEKYFSRRLDLASGRKLFELFLPRSGNMAERQCLSFPAAPMDHEHRGQLPARAAVVDSETFGAVPV